MVEDYSKELVVFYSDSISFYRTLYNALYITPKFPFDEKSFSISRSSSYH